MNIYNLTIPLLLHTSDPDWASYKLGVFVCLTCSGIHRSLSSRVKSIKLDYWEDELVEVWTALSCYYCCGDFCLVSSSFHLKVSMCNLYVSCFGVLEVHESQRQYQCPSSVWEGCSTVLLSATGKWLYVSIFSRIFMFFWPGDWLMSS